MTPLVRGVVFHCQQWWKRETSNKEAVWEEAATQAMSANWVRYSECDSKDCLCGPSCVDAFLSYLEWPEQNVYGNTNSGRRNIVRVILGAVAVLSWILRRSLRCSQARCDTDWPSLECAAGIYSGLLTDRELPLLVDEANPPPEMGIDELAVMLFSLYRQADRDGKHKENYTDIFLGKGDFADYARPEWAQMGESEYDSQENTTERGDTVKMTDTKGTTKNDSNEIFKNPLVVREGEKIILPRGMSCEQGIEALTRQKEEDDRNVSIDIVLNTFLFEGMYALQQAMKEKFGWVDMVPTPGFFGKTPPMFITIDISVTEKAQVVWGRMEIPGIDGYIQTGVRMKEGRPVLVIGGVVKQRFRKDIDDLAALTESYVANHSIYRNKAVRITFISQEQLDNGSFDITDCPKFIDTSKTDPDQLIFATEVQESINTNIFTIIEKTDICRAHGVSLKRGVLLSGGYGVGKSLTAAVTAKKCEDNGWTYFYLEEAKDVAKGLVLARQYMPCTLFVEDVDKAMKGSRDPAMDKILNTMDGIDGKNVEVMTIFTTNEITVINPAILRARRLDAVINVLPPDQDAVRRLILRYTRGSVESGANLDQVGKMLAGQIPATIEEVCTRARLAAAGRLPRDTVAEVLTLNSKDLEISAYTMLQQIKMTTMEVRKEYTDDVERAAEILGNQMSKAIGNATDGVVNLLMQASSNNQKKTISSSQGGSPLPSPGS